MRSVRWLLPLALLPFLAGCSGGDGEGSGAPSVAATGSAATSPIADEKTIRAELAAVFAGDHSGENARAEGRCFAEGLLALIDAEGLRAAGIIGSDGHVADPVPVLDREVAGHWVDAQEACVDFVTASTRALTAQSKGKLDGVAYQECLRAALTKEEMRAALVEALSGGVVSTEVEALTVAQSDCASEALPAD